MRSTSLHPNLPPLSVIALGTSAFGSEVPEDAAFAQLDTFFAGGGNLLDTAHVYAAWLPGGTGQSERTIGRWLRQRGLTAQVTVATKGGHPALDRMHEHRLRPDAIAQDLNESLERLQCPQVGIYFLHRDAEEVPVGELLTALEDQRRAGKIVAYGASNWRVARLAEAAAWATQNHIRGFAVDQPGWSLAERSPDAPDMPGMCFGNAELLAWHCHSGMGTVAYSSQANGWFAKDIPAYDTPTNRERRRIAEKFARQRGCTPTQVAVAWLTNQTFPAVAVVGPRRPEQLTDSIQAGSLALTPEECTELLA